MGHPNSRMGIVARTLKDGRDICVEGESGLLSVIPSSEIRQWNRSLSDLELTLKNGTSYKIYSSEKPDSLRGPQFHRLWCDELAAWVYVQRTWDMAMLALRLGTDPRVIISTTPKPLKLLKELESRSDFIVTRGSTYENRANLAAPFFQAVAARYEGTRLGRQELMGQIIEDAPGALWTRQQIEDLRIVEVPSLNRIVVGVDPATTSKATSAETGIVTVGAIARGCPCGVLPDLPHAFVLSDDSLRDSPGEWAKVVTQTYGRFSADRIVGEVNNGGDLVEANLRSANASLSYASVHASRGKRKRAEPVAALYEQRRVHHVGAFPELEDQMCLWEGQNEEDADSDEDATFESPDRMDALVWALTDLMIDHISGPAWSSMSLLRDRTL